MMLHELRVDITPILTSAGILGLAVGFGAQTLVKDLIAGFFLTFENQVRVGDVATINGTGGLVEAINLRTIVLRDITGAVHVFPNGSIERLSNLTKDFSYYVIDVGVAYSDDPDDVADVLRNIGRELQADPQLGPNILEPLEVLGVDAFEESQVTLKIRIKTLPLKQWEVGPRDAAAHQEDVRRERRRDPVPARCRVFRRGEQAVPGGAGRPAARFPIRKS